METVALKDADHDDEELRDEFQIPEPTARHIAAGPFHSIVCSNAVRDEDSAVTGTTYRREESIWGFGSNRNFQLGWYRPPESADDFEKDALTEASKLAKDEQDKQYSTMASKPQKLRFDGQSIFEVCCGGNHTVILKKKSDQLGGQVYAMGLGNCGRLGVDRPTRYKDSDPVDIQKNSQSTARRTSIEALLNDSWLPKEPQNYKDIALSTKAVNGLDPKKTRYCEELLNTVILKKWHLRDPVRVIFGPQDLKITRIACGVDHSLAITTVGTIFAWGLGSYGNLGNGSTDDALLPQLVRMPEGIQAVQVAAGMKHSMALIKDGSMYSWGHGGNGRLGQGQKKEASLTPRMIMGHPGLRLKRMIYIAAAEAHSASIDEIGSLYTWGAGSYGRTGHGEEDIDEPIPKVVATLHGTTCTQVALGVLHSIALTKKGTVFSWGSGPATGLDNRSLQGTPLKVKSEPKKEDHEQSIYRYAIVEVACGAFHSMALNTVGDVFIWGTEAEGRLGKGDTHAEERYPTHVMKSGEAQTGWQLRLDNDADDDDSEDQKSKEEEDAQEGSKPKEVYCGGSHSATLLVKADGNKEIWTWGSNACGQLGNGQLTDGYSPKLLSLPDRRFKIVQVAFGVDHCLVRIIREADGFPNVLSWGRNSNGQLGRPTQHPQEGLEPRFIEELKDSIDIAAGEEHSGVIVASGDVYTFGSVENGKLGHDGAITPGSNHTYPDKVNGVGQLVQVSCGAQHTAAIDSKKILYTWGAGWFGRLGHGEMSNEVNPKEIKCFGKRPTFGSDKITKVRVQKIKRVICASYHTAIVTESNGLWLCGRETCVCEPEHTSLPLYFNLATEPDGSEIQVEQYVAGPLHSLLVTKQKSLFVWGENYKGQLACKEKETLLPVRLEINTLHPLLKNAGDVKHIATGISHTVALFTNGELYSWGLQNGGRLAHELSAGGFFNPNEPYRAPNKVEIAWKEKMLIPEIPETEEQNDQKQENGDDAEDEDDAKGKSDGKEKEKFLSMQERLRNEEIDKKEVRLKEEEDKLYKKMKEHFDDILRLWDPPAGLNDLAVVKMQQKGEWKNCEWYLRWLERKMDRSLCRNLWRLDLTRDYPDLDKITIREEVQPKLLFYEELMWFLQQQPCYLAALCRTKNFTPENGFTRRDQRGDTDQNFGPQILNKVVSNLFAELSNHRIRHLYMALIRAVLQHEISDFFKAQRKPEDLFKPSESTSVLLMKIFVKHRHFKRTMHRLITGDGDDEPKYYSLMMLIEDWTVKAKPKKKREAGRRVAQSGGEEDALFAMSIDDVRANEPMGGAAESKSLQVQELYRERLSEHQRTFQKFLNLNTSDDKDHDQEKPKKEKGETQKVENFKEFLDKLKFAPEVQAILACITTILEQKLKKEPDGDKKRDAYVIQPVTRFIMVAVLGEIMEQHEKNFTPAMEASMKKRWKLSLLNQNGNWQDAGQDKEIEAKLAKWSKQMHFNISNLGKFMRLSAFLEFDFGMGESKASGARLRQHLFENFTERKLTGAKDDTETNLTIDLYTSHYDLDDHRVSLDTTDLLELSNVLWLFKDQIMLLDRPEDDRLYRLLDKIQPLKSREDGVVLAKQARKSVKVIGIATNETDITKDGDMILVKEANEKDGKNDQGYELPRVDVESYEDWEEAAARVYKEKVKVSLGKDPDMRLVVYTIDDSNVTHAVYALREPVNLPTVQNDDLKILRRKLTDTKWVNEIKTLHEKQAIQNYLDWFGKREPWDKFPTAKKSADLHEIKKRLWSPAMMYLVAKQNNQHNFLVPHRFLEKSQDLCFCRDCLAPIPRSISPQKQRGRSDLRLIKTFQPIQGRELEGTFPMFEMEELLANKQLEELRRSEYLLVKYDLEEQQKAFTQDQQKSSAQQEGSSMFDLVKAIEKAKKNIDLLRLHSVSEDKLLEHVMDAITHRENHHQYLRAVSDGLNKVNSAYNEYSTRLKSLVLSLKYAVEASEEGALPQQIKNKATDQAVTLTMMGLEKQLKAQRKREQTDEDVLLYPSQCYSAAFLRGKRVIATLGDPSIPSKLKSELPCINFTFTLTEKADWRVRATHKRSKGCINRTVEEHVIFSFDIPAATVEDMKRSGKTAKQAYHNGFVTFNCFYLVQLLSRIASSMA